METSLLQGFIGAGEGPSYHRAMFAPWGARELLLYGGGGALLGSALVATLPGPWKWAAAAPFAGAGLVAWFFRDPERTVPAEPGLLVSPADGHVADIEEVEEPTFLGGRAVRVGIFLSPLDVHVNRSPARGVVRHREFRRGKFLAAYDRRAVEENEACALGIECEAPGGKPPLRVLVRQVVGVAARRIVCPVEPGRALERGERFGMIKFGSRTELWVPVAAGFRCRVAVGEFVRGGSTVLGEAEALR
jgi:phosphatidylserine decarboxylase